jgi:hypothetical protein
MRSRQYRQSKKYTRRHRTRKMRGGKTGKKWTTAIDAAQKTLINTGSLKAAKKTLRKQALTNARKLFGSVGSI